MSEAAPNANKPSGEGDETENRELPEDLGSIIGDIERFSRLSCDLKECLSEITRKLIDSLSELKLVQQALAQKKKELKEIHDLESAAAALEKLQEEHRLKQSELEGLIADQHRAWEEEKTLKEKEDEEYRQTLKLRREQEEEEYRRLLAREQEESRRKLEEELQGIKRQRIEQQELLEQDLLKRERALKEKELEWVRLIQELELFMTRLVDRTRKKNAGTEVTATGPGKGAMHDGAASGALSASENDPEISRELQEGDNPSVADVREMLLSQGRRIETLQADLADSREPLPFRQRPREKM